MGISSTNEDRRMLLTSKICSAWQAGTHFIRYISTTNEDEAMIHFSNTLLGANKSLRSIGIYRLIPTLKRFVKCCRLCKVLRREKWKWISDTYISGISVIYSFVDMAYPTVYYTYHSTIMMFHNLYVLLCVCCVIIF